MPTAQDAYKGMIRDYLSPCLRQLGFKGSGGSYELPSDSHWILLGVQASQFSSAESVNFTINCKVVRRNRYDAARRQHLYLGPKPKPNTSAGSYGWSSRIGKLLPGGEDHWWVLRPTDSIDDLVEDVTIAVRDYVLPAVLAEVAATASDG
jgi:hypothetical protein